MKSTESGCLIFLFFLSSSLSGSAQAKVARQRVNIGCVLGTEERQIQQGRFVAQIRCAFLKTIVSLLWSLSSRPY